MDRPEKARILHEALLGHDGRTLRPDWPGDRQDRLTDALDTLRPELRQGSDHERSCPSCLKRRVDILKAEILAIEARSAMDPLKRKRLLALSSLTFLRTKRTACPRRTCP